ncbi:serine/threonine protein kinase [Nannocystis exedens]|uniref:Serine/threonine protein kinase n=1 Tax=Nannocystis exedens TaxID=54 RepID=A0A1I1YK30_9BACT|nr:serine/threonine-protein kinase [Nannocystis exedens]PCC70343.1 serine/threonine protein kinase [Nannocystis exedens]SFE19388.1 serine/threonine protein kinase [Nannocystis exedens]
MFTEPDQGFRPRIAHDFTGETLGGRYHFDYRIGYGAAASIYAATCKNTGAIFALKVLHPDHDNDAVEVQRFKQEGLLAAQIRHPNLIPAYDAGWLGGRHFIAMELIEGKTLADVLKDGPIPWERSVSIVCDVLAGLAALHERAVAHRDISPNNCILEFIGGSERARLSDLGYARVVEGMSEAEGLKLGVPPESVPTMIFGTPYFIAPERLRGSPGDFRADIYSVGALWYTMLTGEALPDPRDSDPVAVAQRIDLPPTLRAVLLGSVEIRMRRHHSAASMADAIRKTLEDIRAPSNDAIHKMLADLHGQRRRARRFKTFAPLLVVPVWLAVQPEPTSSECPDPKMLVASPAVAACPELPVATPVDPEPEIRPEPAPSAATPTTPPPEWKSDSQVLVEVHADEPRAASRREVAGSARVFNLRRALAKCKPPGPMSLEIAIVSGEKTQIDGEPAEGELGRCVEGVLASHPPKRAETLKL